MGKTRRLIGATLSEPHIDEFAVEFVIFTSSSLA